MKLQQKITVILALVITVLILLLTLTMYMTWYRSIQRQVAMDAMDQAVILAENPVIKEKIIEENGYIAINSFVESIHLKTGIQYLYILNDEGRYFAHPHPDRLASLGASDALKLGEIPEEPSYYYEMTRDAMVEGYAPVYTDGLQSGLVVVGIYNGRILQTMSGFAVQLVVFALVAIGLGVLVAHQLAKNIKRSIFGLEPEEIALLLKDREIVMENIGEGLLAIDHRGKLAMINERAKQLLAQPELVIGTDQGDLLFSEVLEEASARGEATLEREWRLGTGTFLKLEVIRLDGIDPRLRFLCRLEDMSLVRKRAEELTDMKQLTQALRAQNHEFMNKLHTISGLIQLESYEDALSYIDQVTKTKQTVIRQLQDQVRVPALSGLLLAKHSRASERKVHVEITEETQIHHLPDHMPEHDVSSILGNLVDNAIEALAGREDAKIMLTLTSDKEEVRFLVRDNGPGLGPLTVEQVLEKGISSKGPDRGYGLAIVKEKVDRAGGTLTLEEREGLLCVVTLPMKREEDEEDAYSHR